MRDVGITVTALYTIFILIGMTRKLLLLRPVVIPVVITIHTLHVAKLLNQLVRTVFLLDVRFHRLREYAHNIIHLMLVIFCRDLSTHVAQISILLVIMFCSPLLQTFRPPPPTQSSGRLLSSTVQVKLVKLVSLWKYYDFNLFPAVLLYNLVDGSWILCAAFDKKN